MKKLLLFSAFIAIVFASCFSKAKVDPIKPVFADTISATIDGVNVTFNSKDTVRTTGSTGIYITGANDTTSNKIMLFINSTTGLDTGSYITHSPAVKSLQMLFGVGPGYTASFFFFFFVVPNVLIFNAAVFVFVLCCF